MNSESIATAEVRRQFCLWEVLAEAILVAVLGAAVAFAANTVSSHGLKLGRNYFPGATNERVVAPSVPAVSHGEPDFSALTNLIVDEDALAERLKAKGLQLVKREQAVQLFHDPRYQQQLVVFIDARNDEQYQHGHIPGAYHLDPYRPEKYLAAVLPPCQIAEEVVVYCTGGDCEDSQFAAILLRDAGIPIQRLRIYGLGFTDWQSNHLPIEMGERNSGKTQNAAQ